MVKERYNWERDKQDELFEEIFALAHIPISFITKGYCPEYDVLDMQTGEKYEVKRDYRCIETNNILVEEYFNAEAGKEGWLYHTEADYYVIFITDYLYTIINMWKLKNDFFNRISKWYKADIKQEDGSTTINWVTDINNFEHDFFLSQPPPPYFHWNLEKGVL